MVDPKYLAELKKLPDDVLSFSEAASEVRIFRDAALICLILTTPQSLQARYTHMETEAPALPHTIKTKLTPALGKSA